MDCSWQNLVAIVEKSAFFYERLAANFVPAPSGTRNVKEVRRRLDQWQKNAAHGNEEFFKHRLEWDGLTLEQAESLCAGVRLRNAREVPRWTHSLFRVLISFDRTRAPSPFLKTNEPLPFEELIVPFVWYAAEELRSSVQGRDELLSEAARASLKRDLLSRLTTVSSGPLFLEFSVFRAARQAGTKITGHWPGISSSQTQYLLFIAHMTTDGLLPFFSEYAVLARLLASITDQWTVFVSDFLQHLCDDLPVLSQSFACGQPIGRVSQIDCGLSDRHNGGRTSMRIHFENGLILIYKPKNTFSEQVYYDFLAWLNLNGPPLELRVPKVVCRGTHGWAEEVPHRPCEDRQEVERYYVRAGMLLCLMYVLGGTDCHDENVIASGEHPVIVDLETILQTRVRPFAESAQTASFLAANAFYWDSVIRTSMLPYWELEPSGESYDVSGLGGADEQTRVVSDIWQNINSDAMRMSRKTGAVEQERNAVYLKGHRVHAAEYCDEIVQGFEGMYRLLMLKKPVLLTPGGPLAAVDQLRLRFILRHSRIYSAMLDECSSLHQLRDGMDASILMDLLVRPLAGEANERPFLWSVLAAESSALLQGDIPLFSFHADNTALWIGPSRCIEGVFSEPSAVLLRSCLKYLDERDLALQVSYVRASFSSARPSAIDSVIERDLGSIPGTDFAQHCLEEAVSIAEQVLSASIKSEESATWLTMAYLDDGKRRQLQPMSPCLYDGTCGTALFLAAVERIVGGGKFRAIARAGFRTVTDALAPAPGSKFARSAGIGAGLGVGSLVYALTRAGQMLMQEDLLLAAESASRLITREHIDSDRRLDLLSGAAGGIVGLLTLHVERRYDWLLDLAIDCGRHLLRSRIAGPAGFRAWPTLGRQLLTGFSHGAAGIAYALCRLHQVTGERAFRDAAAEACAYEDGLYSESDGNWPDLQSSTEQNGRGFLSSWCHGAPGIALGRIGALVALDTPDVRRDIHCALETTARQPTGQLDHLCCGSLGRAEVLLIAGNRLDIPEYCRLAERLGSAVIHEARRRGRYELGWGARPYIASFHQGMAGIGYQLLRLARPHDLPSVLMWD